MQVVMNMCFLLNPEEKKMVQIRLVVFEKNAHLLRKNDITELCPFERDLMLFPTLGPSSLPVVLDQTNERHVNRTKTMQTTKNIQYRWSGMTDT